MRCKECGCMLSMDENSFCESCSSSFGGEFYLTDNIQSFSKIPWGFTIISL